MQAQSGEMVSSLSVMMFSFRCCPDLKISKQAHLIWGRAIYIVHQHPMLLGKRVKGQRHFQIALQTLDGSRIDLLILLNKGGYGLIGGSPILLVEQGAQFRFDLLLVA